MNKCVLIITYTHMHTHAFAHTNMHTQTRLHNTCTHTRKHTHYFTERNITALFCRLLYKTFVLHINLSTFFSISLIYLEADIQTPAVLSVLSRCQIIKCTFNMFIRRAFHTSWSWIKIDRCSFWGIFYCLSWQLVFLKLKTRATYWCFCFYSDVISIMTFIE